MIIKDKNSFNILVIQVNKAAIDHYGYSEEEFLSMTIIDISPEEDVSKLKKILSKKGADNKINYQGKFRHYKKSKELLEVDIYSNFVMINNKQKNLVIAIDVTEKNLVEHQITRA